MSQLVKSKSQMGGTLVSAFYERSEEDNDNGEILSIAHAVEVTPEYQPLKPYSKEFRNRVDDISKRRQFKDEAFNGKNTIEDMYSKRVVQKNMKRRILMSRSLSNKDAGFRNKQERAEYFLLDERRLRQTKVTDLDRKLWEKVIQFSDFFEDMLFTPGTITYPFLECKISDDNGNEIAPTAVLPVGLHNFNYNSFYYRVREMTPPYMACFNKANYSLKVDPRHIDDDYVILHEMIHMHEFVLEIYPTYYHDAILYSLYHDLRSKIEDLDRRMERQGHIVMQEELAQFGGVHDLLFLLKSFDLDLRMNYPLGTVFGYGMAD